MGGEGRCLLRSLDTKLPLEGPSWRQGKGEGKFFEKAPYKSLYSPPSSHPTPKKAEPGRRALHPPPEDVSEAFSFLSPQSHHCQSQDQQNHLRSNKKTLQTNRTIPNTTKSALNTPKIIFETARAIPSTATTPVHTVRTTRTLKKKQSHSRDQKTSKRAHKKRTAEQKSRELLGMVSVMLRLVLVVWKVFLFLLRSFWWS